jgi:RimJ/RimL family protein N-acetyltransferase
MTSLGRPPIDTLGKGNAAVIKTERLVLRAPRQEDAKRVASLVNDRRIAENTTRIPHPYGIEDAQEWIGAAISQSAAIYLMTVGGEVIGACGLEPRDGVPEIGYWVGVPFWGSGYATEAARGLIDHAFGECSHEVLTSGARVSNPASRRVLEKCGFQWTGVGLYRIRAISSSAPIDRFRLERSIWASLKSWGAERGSRTTRRGVPQGRGDFGEV